MKIHSVLMAASLAGLASAREPAPLPEALSAYQLPAAALPERLLLEPGDRIALCGDSITEQKQYSVIIESYLTACMPQLGTTCRQYGWSGEQTGGFLGRQRSDVLRFKPTFATTCYGMNDFRYVPYDEGIAAEYRKNLTAMTDAFQAAGTRVLLGSPGIIDTVPHWVNSATGTQEQLNQSLARFRGIAQEVAAAEKEHFADVFRPMLVADYQAEQRYGPDFKVAGKDGVHPGWAGQVVMAQAFLTSMGLEGDLGTITINRSGKAKVTEGHEVVSSKDGSVTIRSRRLPFSPGPGPLDKDDSIRAGMDLARFDEELNRFTLRMVDAEEAATYAVTWGKETKNYPGAELKAGVNLAAGFPDHPLVPAFRKVWDAVVAKQDYETRQIKSLVHGPEGAADLEATFELTEKVHKKLADELAGALQPAEHVITVARQ